MIVGKITLAWPLNPTINRFSIPELEERSKLGELGTFSPAVNEGFQALWIIWIDHVHQSGVYPSPRLNRVQAAYDQIELHVILLVLVLYFTKVSAVA